MKSFQNVLTFGTVYLYAKYINIKTRNVMKRFGSDVSNKFSPLREHTHISPADVF